MEIYSSLSTRLLWDVRQDRDTTSRLPLRSEPERATEETPICLQHMPKLWVGSSPHSLNTSIEAVAAGAGNKRRSKAG